MTRHRSIPHRGFIAVAALLTSSLLACGGGPELDRAVWEKRGAETLAPFKAQLMGALMDGLQEGPDAAIDVCQLVAPEIAAEVSSPGIEVGRTSHRLRNEQNAPRDWVRPLLETYRSTPGKSMPQVVRLDHGAVGYVEPIFVNSVCLSCHGTDVSPDCLLYTSDAADE